MNALSITSKSQFLEQLEDAFKQKVSQQEALRIIEFARQQLAHVSLEELLGTRFSDVYGAILGAWQFVQKRSEGKTPVSVFNPGLESHGWQSTHTVIFILHPNEPFLIDSVRMAINDRGIGIHRVQHALMRVERDSSGQLVSFSKAGSKEAAAGADEALIVFEIDRHSDPQELAALEDRLQEVLGEVRIVVSDFEAMKEKALALAAELDAGPKDISAEDVAEAQDFVRWLTQDHFTFLGYDEYDLVREGQQTMVKRAPDSGLGILRLHNERAAQISLADLPRRTREALTRTDELFIFAKSAQRSRVHRPAYPDYIAVKKFNDKGEVTGERRFLGLYTARAFSGRPEEIPLLRRKVAEVLDTSGFPRDDYSGKELDQILAVYPRDELFQIGPDELGETALSILQIQERRQVRLFMREDVYGQFVTCLAFFPRDIYNTELRLKVERVLCDRLGAEDISFITHFSESILARVQFTIRVPQVDNRVLPVEELQQEIIELAQSWRDGLAAALHENCGEERGNELLRLYEAAFPASYQDLFSPQRAAVDLEHIRGMTEDEPIAMSFYRVLEEGENTLHFKLFNPDVELPLSDIMPIFENLGFRVIGEHPFEVVSRDGKRVWIHDFSLQSFSGDVVDIQRLKPVFEELFRKIWFGEAENDGFNKLLLAAYLGWRDIAILRTYARYMQQIRFSNSQSFIASTLINHVGVTRQLLQFFDSRFNPAHGENMEAREAAGQKLIEEISAALDAVENLSEDRVLRLYLELMQATLRTNYYQLTDEGQPKSYISIKLDPRSVPDMPLPVPVFEIFVYSARVEGVHLRGGKVARGGLRWSDRNEDYRTEILGLVKAQQVKNSVIVPEGAKGGFVAKGLPDPSDRDAFQAAGVEAYRTFIKGLLDITDNLVDEKIQPPVNVVRPDGDDPYLVVAADKGTATFSDIANKLAEEYNFWMGDAFASGGSNGYDHKKMGITARGAWVSVARHFREMGINPAQETFTAIGVGDMGGDVFGNGMLRSDKTRLVAAFNHMHIFVDPDPDPAISFAERKRLFEMPRSAWSDYNPELISAGGGVFSRSAKSIPVSPEMKTLLGIEEDQLSPTQLISCVLRAEVDLLWIGGIGTYVKGTEESHADVGDKSNDSLRINGKDLRCRIVGEGGNLGMTQLGRIEYALQGGRLNADFIDNSGGVDCSDHEVNMKILFNQVMAAGELTLKQRNEMLEEMTGEVGELVLLDNYRQTQAISIAQAEAYQRMEEYRRLMAGLEASGKLNRALEFLPDDEALEARKQAGKGLTRPELAVLLAYVKADLKQKLIDSSLPDDPMLTGEMFKLFPGAMVNRFRTALEGHQLKREIIATQVANDMVNHMGITFVDRMQQSTGADPASIALAWIIAREVFQLEAWWGAVERLDNEVSAEVQIQLMNELARLIRRAVRWLLRNRRSELHIQNHLDRFTGKIGSIARGLSDYLGETASKEWQAEFRKLEEEGVPSDLAAMVSGGNYLYSALGIIEIHEAAGVPLKTVANLYYTLGEKLELNWCAEAITDLSAASYWETLARERFREDLHGQQRLLTTGVLQMVDTADDAEASVESWMDQHETMTRRWTAMLEELKTAREPEYAMYSVALRELADLAQSALQTRGVQGKPAVSEAG